MHLAAGMLAAGFKSVIGTMWAIPDEAAPVVAEKFYRKLFEGQSGTIDIGEGKTAEALHFAVQELKNEGYGFMAWMPFIHLGAYRSGSVLESTYFDGWEVMRQESPDTHMKSSR